MFCIFELFVVQCWVLTSMDVLYLDTFCTTGMFRFESFCLRVFVYRYKKD